MNIASKNDDSELEATVQAGQALMLKLIAAFPQCSDSWETHSREWKDESVPYLDISVFARFVDDQLLMTGEAAEAKRAFVLLESLFLEGDEDTRDLIGFGFIEDLANITSCRGDGNAQVVALLPPILTKVWWQIATQWSSKSSLMEVIEAEANHPQSARTWSDLIGLL